MAINILDDLTISKIAAGEIIENPASIVKELIENSIDANSKNIVIEVRGNIWEYIKVSDDGDGILNNEIEKAFHRHATSKLSNFNDLDAITTLGFRGEALASIASISKIEILTKTESDLAGTRAVLKNGNIIDRKNIGMPRGTTIYIKDVFFNTPVRRKFLKSNSSEFNMIQDVVKKISLGTPNISFKLIRDSRVVFSKSAVSNLKDHIFSILGRDISNHLIESNYENEKYKIKAFFSDNALYRSNRLEQYIYINGRFVKNLEISKSIEKAYYSQIPLGRFPVFVIYIEIDPAIVDVNIHPKKHEVKFATGEVLVQILKDLAENTLIPNRDFIKHTEVENNKENVNIFELYENNHEINQEKILDDFSNYATPNEKIFEIKKDILFDENTTNDTYNFQAAEGEEKFEFNEDKEELNLIDSNYIGSLFNTYLIFQKDKEEWFLIDQHAAHERVKYEQFIKQFNNKQVDSQLLLKPEIFEVNNVELDKFDEFTENLAMIGFEIEKFSDNSLIVRSIPSIIDGKYEDFLRQSLDVLNEKITSAYQVNPYSLMKKACKAAVKANEKLSYIEVKQLIKDLVNCEDPYTCPHGRPTLLKMKKRDLEKMFLRG